MINFDYYFFLMIWAWPASHHDCASLSSHPALQHNLFIFQHSHLSTTIFSITEEILSFPLWKRHKNKCCLCCAKKHSFFWVFVLLAFAAKSVSSAEDERGAWHLRDEPRAQEKNIQRALLPPVSLFHQSPHFWGRQDVWLGCALPHDLIPGCYC